MLLNANLYINVTSDFNLFVFAMPRKVDTKCTCTGSES